MLANPFLVMNLLAENFGYLVLITCFLYFTISTFYLLLSTLYYALRLISITENPCVFFSRTPTPVNIWPKLQIFRFSLYQFLTGFLLVTTPMVVTVSSGDECSNYQSVPCELPQAQGGVRHADGGQHHTGVEDKTLSSTASFCAFVDTRPYWLRHYVASVEIWQIYSLMIPFPSFIKLIFCHVFLLLMRTFLFQYHPSMLNTPEWNSWSDQTW